MSSRLQLDVRNLSRGRRHLVNAYQVKAGIGVIAGNTVWSMPERLEYDVLQKGSYYKYYLLPSFKVTQIIRNDTLSRAYVNPCRSFIVTMYLVPFLR